jgi:outer membrane protein
VGNLKLRQANGTLSAGDLQAINDTLAIGGRASVQSEASPTQPSAATQSPVPVPPAYVPSPVPSAIPVVPPVVTPPFNPQPPAMPVPPPPPVIEQLPTR